MPQFQKGQSGNPTGRPVGIKDRRTALREALEGRSMDLLNKAVEKALEGDTSVLIALMSRLIPSLRPEAAPVGILDPGVSLPERSERVLDAMMQGDLSPTAAQDFTNLLLLHGKILEIGALVERIESLEAKLNAAT